MKTHVHLFLCMLLLLSCEAGENIDQSSKTVLTVIIIILVGILLAMIYLLWLSLQYKTSTKDKKNQKKSDVYPKTIYLQKTAEIILLANDCVDDSAKIPCSWKKNKKKGFTVPAVIEISQVNPRPLNFFNIIEEEDGKLYLHYNLLRNRKALARIWFKKKRIRFNLLIYDHGR